MTGLKTPGSLSIAVFYGNQRCGSQWKYIFEVLVKSRSLTGALSDFAEENFITAVWHVEHVAVITRPELTSRFLRRKKCYSVPVWPMFQF